MVLEEEEIHTRQGPTTTNLISCSWPNGPDRQMVNLSMLSCLSSVWYQDQKAVYDLLLAIVANA